MVQETQISERRACRLIGMHRWTFRYPGKPRDDRRIRERMRELAHRGPRFGYRRLILLRRREGIEVHYKKAYRIYTEEDLKVRRKRKKIRSRVRTAPLPVPSKPNERWSMDFMQDCLADGRRFRVLTIVDDFTRECPAVEVDTSIPGARMVRVLGSEFTGKVLDAWANRRGIKLHFIDPGRPMQSAYVESFNGKFRDECLDQNWFTDLADAKEKIESRRQSYNTVRPRSSLNDDTPAEFAGRFEEPKSDENPLVQLF